MRTVAIHRTWTEPLRRRAVIAAGLTLLVLLWLKLLAALFGALAGYVLYTVARSPAAAPPSLGRRVGNMLLAAVLIAGGVLAIVEGVELLLNASSDGLPRLMQLLADTLDRIRGSVPGWIAGHLPDSAQALQEAVSNWLRTHAGEMQHWGSEALHLMLHLTLGLAIGVIAGVSMTLRQASSAALPALARERWHQLALAFRDVVAAQLRIALVNALLTALFLLALLPAFGVHVPLAVTLSVFTFFAGLLPIVGNLLSNTAIVIASLTVSPWVGIASLVFLVTIHKLEYFLNAHFVGSRVQIPAYALLATMLILEAAFGVAGVVAAPIYCAWLARELRENGWI